MIDVVIVGAGPVGLAAAIQAKRQKLTVVIVDKGIIVNSLYHFPTHMTFFTSADLLEIGNHPIPSTSTKPTRQMMLDYYRLVAKNEELDIRQYHLVQSVDGVEGNFFVRGKSKHKINQEYTYAFELRTKYVIIATGYFDNPNQLNISGTSLPHVSHYYSDPYQFYQQNVVIIGAGNSGAEAALDLYRHGAHVTLLHRYAKIKSTVKYWIAPDLQNRINEGSIAAFMPAQIIAITESGVIISYNGVEQEIAADFVFILIGFKPNVKFLKNLNLQLNDDSQVILTSRFESTRNGVFVIGSAGFGRFTNAVFIENGRDHALFAVNELASRIHNSNYIPIRQPYDNDIQSHNT